MVVDKHPEARHMEFVESDATGEVSEPPPASASSVIAGQTWTRQLGKCNDPSCVQVHVNGAHAWMQESGAGVKGDGNNDDDDSHDYIGPADRIVNPLDVLEKKPEATDSFVYVVGTRGQKVTVIGNSLTYMKDNLEDLTLRSNLIRTMSGVETLPRLQRLELYDNQVESISHIEELKGLRVLDLSFNAIRDMGAVASCPLLEELYIAQNKLRKIEGLEGMIHLKILDLGANRIRSMAGASLHTLCNLESLWLGKNKIERIQGVNTLINLRKLDVQNNRLKSIRGLQEEGKVEEISEGAGEEGGNGEDGEGGNGIADLPALEELYLAFNGIENVDGLPEGSPLHTVDLSNNPLSDVDGIEKHPHLTELWINACKIATLDQLKPLQQLPALTCLYLEHSPLAKDFEYRKAVTSLLPPLEQLDATPVNRGK